MINPSNLQIYDELRNSNGSVLEFDNINEYDDIEYDLDDIKDFNKYISDIKKDVRNSYEYSQYIKYLREYFGMYKSGNFEDVNILNNKNVKIEIHHTPYTLEDIVRIVYEKRKFYNQNLSVQMMSKEIMELHYKGIIGLYPLSKTEHELVHNSILFIPVSKIFGKYELFTSLYSEFIDQDKKELLNNIEEYSKAYDEEYQKNLLSQSNIYLDTSNIYQLPLFDNIKSIMDNKIKSIKNNSYQLPLFEDEKKEEMKNVLEFI